MNLKTLTVAAVLLSSLAGVARAEDSTPAPAPVQTQPQAGDRQRLRDGSGAGGQYRYGAQSGAARGTCDGTMKRDRLRDGSGAGARRGRMGGGRQ